MTSLSHPPEQDQPAAAGAPAPATARRRLAPLLGIAAFVLIAATVALLVTTGRLSFGPAQLHGLVLAEPRMMPNFSLTDQNGDSASLYDYRGQVVLLYFGYTYCPDVCPATLAELRDALEELGRRRDEVQVIMVTVDPARDTPAILGEYLAFFDPSFVGLSGSDEEIRAAAAPFGVFYEAHEGSAASGYLVDHTATVALLDKRGNLRLFYPFNMPAEDIAADLRVLVRE